MVAAKAKGSDSFFCLSVEFGKWHLCKRANGIE